MNNEVESYVGELRKLRAATNIFDLAKGTVCEPKEGERTDFPTPDVFLEYNGVKFGIGMDEKLYIHENKTWRKA